MRLSIRPLNTSAAIATIFVLSAASMLSPARTFAQMSMPATTSPSQSDPATQSQDTQAQITLLKQQVAQLQAALQQRKAKTPAPANGMTATPPPMQMEDDSSEMGAMPSGAAKPPMGTAKGGMGMDGMSKMPPAGAIKGGTAAPMSAPGCCGMSMGMPMAKGGMKDDKMGSMPNGPPARMKAKPMAVSKAAEAPSLLYIGAKDFFLDHQQHLNISAEQKSQLQTIKNDASNQKSTSQSEIDKAQEELWQLTSADRPSSTAIDSKVQEVGQLRAAEQVAFIHSVSAASNVLTPEQRLEALAPMTSTKALSPKKAKPPSIAPMKM